MKAVPGILPTLLEMICFFSTPTIDVEPYKKGNIKSHVRTVKVLAWGFLYIRRADTPRKTAKFSYIGVFFLCGYGILVLV